MLPFLRVFVQSIGRTRRSAPTRRARLMTLFQQPRQGGVGGGVGFQVEEGIPIIELFTAGQVATCPYRTIAPAPRELPCRRSRNRLFQQTRMRPLRGNLSFAERFSFVIPVSEPTNARGFDGIHFDFSPGKAATSLLLRGVWMRNSENSLFVFLFDSDPPRQGVKTSERGAEKAKAKMDSGFRRNDGRRIPPRRRDVCGVVGKTFISQKSNPPYPPLTGGQKKKTPQTKRQEKTKAPLPAEDAAFSYPPVKGG